MKQQDDSADLWADEDSLHFKDVPNIFGFFFRPTPSWLSPGRSTCSIACRKRINRLITALLGCLHMRGCQKIFE